MVGCCCACDAEEAFQEMEVEDKKTALISGKYVSQSLPSRNNDDPSEFSELEVFFKTIWEMRSKIILGQKMKNIIKDLEATHYHCEALLLECFEADRFDLIKELCEIIIAKNKAGYLTDDLNEKRWGVVKRLREPNIIN